MLCKDTGEFAARDPEAHRPCSRGCPAIFRHQSPAFRVPPVRAFLVHFAASQALAAPHPSESSVRGRGQGTCRQTQRASKRLGSNSSHIPSRAAASTWLRGSTTTDAPTRLVPDRLRLPSRERGGDSELRMKPAARVAPICSRTSATCPPAHARPERATRLRPGAT